ECGAPFTKQTVTPPFGVLPEETTESLNVMRPEPLQVRQRAQQIDAEQVSLLYRQTPAGCVATVVNAGIVTAVLWKVVAHPLLLAWFGLLTVILLSLFVLLRLYPRQTPTVDRTRFWRTLFIIGVGCGATVGGAAGVLLFPYDSLVHQVFLVFVLGGMATGAVAVLSPVMAAFLAVFIPTLLPLTVQLFLQGDAVHVPMGLLLLSFAGVLLVMAHHQQASITESLRLRFENLDLIHHLSVTKEVELRATIAEAVNQRLEKEIVERKQMEEALRYRVKMETLISALSTSFINLAPGEIDRAINDALQAVGEFAGVDRSYLFLAYDNETKVDNTHEWCAAGVAPQMSTQQGLRVEAFPWAVERLRRLGTVHIPRVAELPPEAQAEKALLQAQGVQSLIMVLIVYGGRPLGFLGFDAVRVEKTWMEEDIALLKMLGEIFATALERQRTEEELLKAKERAEAANHAKDEFLATMSHELRTPLNVILGYTDLLLEETFGSLSEEQAHPLRRINSNARELLDLIIAVLDVSRLEAGRLPMDVKEVQLPVVLKELEVETQEVYQRSGLHFQWELDEGFAPIHTDPEKLKVVLRNLIGNAVKFTPQGDITVKACPKSGGVEVRVSDTGIGIPPEAVAVIFEPFRQVESTATRQYGGAGLGLHIVKRLVELLGGTVAVESEVGCGSTFRVWVPRESPTFPEVSSEVEL
ncbi:MAG TPA: HAMP domain-containing sensor histidine kinase, partial [Candidatus Binatia bacterium]|nr:HAMP domain-containing sensor histidine kinase [Candidatus Binatia bacterium]